MSVNVSSTASGLDIHSMVNELVEAERKPRQQRIDKQLSTITTDISAYGQVKAALEQLKQLMQHSSSQQHFSSYLAKSSDNNKLTATAYAKAFEGAYEIEVLSLAKPQ